MQRKSPILKTRNGDISELTMRKITWNGKVAKSRGDGWKKSLVAGKLKAKMNPTSLQTVRARKSIPQIDVAQGLGLSLSTYGAIERSRRLVKEDIAKKIAGYFGKSPKQLFKSVRKGKFVAK